MEYWAMMEYWGPDLQNLPAVFRCRMSQPGAVIKIKKSKKAAVIASQEVKSVSLAVSFKEAHLAELSRQIFFALLSTATSSQFSRFFDSIA